MHHRPTDSHRRRPARRAMGLLLVGALAMTGAACSSDDEAGDDRTGTSGTAAPSTVATDDTTASTEDEPTTTASTAPAETTTTGADGGTEVAGPVVLRLDGVGSATIGQDAEAAVTALSAELGEPSGSQPWVQPSCELAGPDSDGARSVSWGGLTIVLRGATEADATFAGWSYSGGAAGTADELYLDTGVGVGAPGDDLAIAYGDAATYVPDEMFGNHWEVVQGGATLWAPVDGDAAVAPIARFDLNPGICE